MEDQSDLESIIDVLNEAAQYNYGRDKKRHGVLKPINSKPIMPEKKNETPLAMMAPKP